MAGEEPEVGLQVEHGPDQALAVFPALFGDLGDSVEHQHRRQRKLGIARPEQLAAAAGEQILVVEAGPLVFHSNPRRSHDARDS